MTAVTSQHLVSTPDVRNGRLRLAGSRISVDDIVSDYVHKGMSVEEIVGTFDLNPAAVHAALAHYYDNRDEIDEQIRADERIVAEYMKAHQSPLFEKLKALK